MIANLFAKLSSWMGGRARVSAPATAATSSGKPSSTAASLVMTLQDAIRRIHKCECTHAGTLPMTLDTAGKIVFLGKVEVFSLKGHPKAKRCYAWMHPPSRPTQAKAVLEVPPIDSPRKAVYSVILREAGSAEDLSTSSQFVEAVKSIVKRG